MIYWQLFLSFFKIGLFAIGGAYSFLPLTEKEIVERYHWLTKSEFLDVSGIVKMFPGAISVKYATYTGYKIGGIWGAFVANFANILAPAAFVLTMTVIYGRFKNSQPLQGAFKMVQLVVFAMIVAVAFQTIDISQLTRLSSLIIIFAAFFIFMYTKIDPAIVIILAGILGASLSFIK